MNTDSLTDTSALAPEGAARRARKEARRNQLLRAAGAVLQDKRSDEMSMQDVAHEAGVSVGLIYRYFTNKDALLLALIVTVLDELTERVPAAVAAAGEDPVERVSAAFTMYCRVIDENRQATLITYRESKSLTAANRTHIKSREVESVRPLVEAIQEAVRSGAFVELDAELLAYDLVLLAHGWALKSWYFEPQHTFDSYVRGQLRLVLAAAVAPERRRARSARGPASGEARKSAPRAVPESVHESDPEPTRESTRDEETRHDR